jgi:hypothetical protein
MVERDIGRIFQPTGAEISIYEGKIDNPLHISALNFQSDTAQN